MSFINSINWRAAMQNVSATIDSTMGEAFTITPVNRKPNFEGCADESNAIIVQGVFQWKSHLALESGSRFHREHGAGGIVESRKPVVSFSRAALPWMLRKGDRITRQCSGDMFEITAVKPNGVARIDCDLVQLGVQSQ